MEGGRADAKNQCLWSETAWCVAEVLSILRTPQITREETPIPRGLPNFNKTAGSVKDPSLSKPAWFVGRTAVLHSVQRLDISMLRLKRPPQDRGVPLLSFRWVCGMFRKPWSSGLDWRPTPEAGGWRSSPAFNSGRDAAQVAVSVGWKSVCATMSGRKPGRSTHCTQSECSRRPLPCVVHCFLR